MCDCSKWKREFIFASEFKAISLSIRSCRGTKAEVRKKMDTTERGNSVISQYFAAINMGAHVAGGRCSSIQTARGLNRGANMPSNGQGRDCTGGVKATHGNGGRHLSQGVIRLVGQRLSAQELPDRLGGGEQVDHGQKGLERREKQGKT